jgi:hypothetical protein
MIIARAIARQAKYIPQPPANMLCPCCGKPVRFGRLKPIDYDECWFIQTPVPIFKVNAVYYRKCYCSISGKYIESIHITISANGISKWFRNWRFSQYGLCEEIAE